MATTHDDSAAENAGDTTPIAASAAHVPAPVAVPEKKNRRGLIIAGGSLAALLVLAGTFAGGVALGTTIDGRGGGPTMTQGDGQFPGGDGSDGHAPADGQTPPNWEDGRQQPGNNDSTDGSKDDSTDESTDDGSDTDNN